MHTGTYTAITEHLSNSSNWQNNLPELVSRFINCAQRLAASSAAAVPTARDASPPQSRGNPENSGSAQENVGYHLLDVHWNIHSDHWAVSTSQTAATGNKTYLSSCRGPSTAGSGSPPHPQLQSQQHGTRRCHILGDLKVMMAVNRQVWDSYSGFVNLARQGSM